MSDYYDEVCADNARREDALEDAMESGKFATQEEAEAWLDGYGLQRAILSGPGSLRAKSVLIAEIIGGK